MPVVTQHTEIESYISNKNFSFPRNTWWQCKPHMHVYANILIDLHEIALIDREISVIKRLKMQTRMQTSQVHIIMDIIFICIYILSDVLHPSTHPSYATS